uniref:Cyclase associated actin cytoskeleton regulatory protein 2 n=1 Tax=Gadus morhua TaxID=8049 RepID=A0A8C5B8C7_GADMO
MLGMVRQHLWPRSGRSSGKKALVDRVNCKTMPIPTPPPHDLFHLNTSTVHPLPMMCLHLPLPSTPPPSSLTPPPLPQMELSDLLKPIADHIQEIQQYRERHRGSSLFNHLSAVSESIPALGWVAVNQKPAPYVKEMNDAATFYTNRVLKDYKETDRRHVEWVQSYLSVWTEMQAFIRQHHTTGVTWCRTGPVAPPPPLEGAPSAACPPPPPPPPGPPPVLHADGAQTQADGVGGQTSALFAQLNQGMDITKGLKHVAEGKKTHKNPELRSQGSPSHAPPAKASKPGSTPSMAPPKRPALLELDGKKWRVEHFEQRHDLLIEETELKQVVYIFDCNNSTIQVKGKINSIIVDNCKKLGLVFENAVGIVEIINSKSVQLQVLGNVPTISINKTEGCQVYLSKDSISCDIVSAKSSAMNILVPVGEDDFREFPVPEQFKTVWDGSRLVTEPTEIAG